MEREWGQSREKMRSERGESGERPYYSKLRQTVLFLDHLDN